MSPAMARTARWLRLVLGFPAGVGQLIDNATRKRLLLSFVGAVVLSLLDMMGVVAMLPLMQYITNQRDGTAVARIEDILGHPSDQLLVGALAALVVGAFVVKDCVALVFRRWQLHFMANLQTAISTRIFERYLQVPYRWHLSDGTGDKLWTVQGAVSMGYMAGIAAALAMMTEVLTITFIFISLFALSPAVTLGAILYFGLATLAVQRTLRPRILAASRRNQAAARALNKVSLQSLAAAKEVKLRRAEGRFVKEFHQESDRSAHANASALFLGEVPKYLLEIVFIFGVGLLAVAVGASADSSKGLTLLGIFVAAGTRIVPSAVRLVNAFGTIRFSRAPLAHVIHVVQSQESDISAEMAERKTDVVPRGDLCVRGLHFSYSDEPDEQVLAGVDLDIPEGSSVAIVGASGAGKSTLVDILLGLHRPDSGLVTAGGVNIRDNLPGWQSRIAVVPQEVTLLDETLAANVAFDQDVDATQLRDALSGAQLRDFVEALPRGLDTEIGERGVRLSGGQRQRIGIARALYRQPELLVLDEATSALDNETERSFTQMIEGLKGKMTIVIVAHRLSTVRHCDLIVFMEEGRVANVGSFEQVRAINRRFAHLVELANLAPDALE